MVCYCRNCRNEVEEDAVVCLSCGLHPHKRENYCNSCGEATIVDQEICLNCGKKLANANDAKNSAPNPQVVIHNSNNNNNVNNNTNTNTASSSNSGCLLILAYFFAVVVPYIMLPVGTYWIVRPNPNLKKHGIVIVVISFLTLMALNSLEPFGPLMAISIIISIVIAITFYVKRK